jgi:uncharacterized membrane protein
MKRALLALFSLVALVAACGGANTIDSKSCPTAGTKLSYANFGQAFVSKYCGGCHTGGSSRGGVSIDSQANVQKWKADVFKQAAGSNTSMPPSGSTAPTQAERDQLAEWLACGAP